jgi:membrane-bound serine protease (ClpP class)
MRGMVRPLRLSLALLLLLTVAAALAWPPPSRAQAGPLVLEVTLEGAIDAIAVRTLNRAIAQAEDEDAAALLVRLDTPGGDLESTRKMVRAIFDARVPVMVHVAPEGARAGSAGTFIAAAAHIAAMAPTTSIGAASPVLADGTDIPGDVLREKVYQDAAALMREIAAQRGRAVEPLEATVLEALAYGAEEALALGVVDLLARDTAGVLAAVDRRTVDVRGQPFTLATAGASVLPVRSGLAGFADGVLAVLANPTVAWLLLVVGSLGLLFELSTPGLIIPGVLGFLFLLAGYAGFAHLPMNWLGAALVFAAFILFAVEMNIDGFGVAGAAGIAAFAGGSVLLYLHFTEPSPLGPARGFSLWVLVPVGIVVVGAATGMVYGVARARRSVRGLPEPVGWSMAGARGRVVEALAPQGRVLVRGETWNARVVYEETVPEGAEVRVVRTEGALVWVEQASGASPGPEHERGA